MTSTTLALYQFQYNYLLKLVDNISEEQLFSKQSEGYNSAGWILGHICVEAEDVFHYLNIDYPKVPEPWFDWFRNGFGKLDTLADLPAKSELLDSLHQRYSLLAGHYAQLSDTARQAPHPSQFMKSLLPDVDSWFAHHLVTHIAVHCGNIVVWKKLLGLEVGGY